MKTLAEKIAVMRAYLEGKPVEYLMSSAGWELCDKGATLDFDWIHNDYRIKPSPKMRLMGVEELPAVFYVRKTIWDEEEFEMATSFSKNRLSYFHEGSGFYLDLTDETQMREWQWSLDRKTICSFMVEEDS